MSTFSGAQLVCQGQSCWARQLSDCMCGRTAACIAAIVSCWLTAGWVGTENESFPSNMWARPSVSPPIWHWIPLRTAEETSGNLPALLEPSDGAWSCWSGIKAPASNQLALTLFTSEHFVTQITCNASDIGADLLFYKPYLSKEFSIFFHNLKIFIFLKKKN